jgi:hypothetical protein
MFRDIPAGYMRDDFPLKTIETLAKRVGCRCSNPGCRKLTSGPHEEAHKSVNIGVAAHITAAAPGGKRYNPGLSSEERKSIENGMWLCQNCGKLIDSNEQKYSVEILEAWKHEAEQQAQSEVEKSMSQAFSGRPIDDCVLTDYLRTITRQAKETEDWRDGRYVGTQAQLPLKVQTVKPQESLEQTKKQEAPQKFNVLEGLREFYLQEPVLLIGKPGSGKSTALRRLLLEEAQEGALIPVLILLRSCDQGKVEDWIGEVLDVEVTEVRSLLKAKRLLLLFDGLNEVPNLEAYRSLTKFLEKPIQVPMVFTTRELGADTSLGIGRKLEMLPLTEPQMYDFIEMRLPGQGQELIRQLGDRLRDLAETPMLLSMLCQVFDPKAGVPKNRGELFRNKFVQDFDAIKHKGVVAADSGFFRFKDELLQHLAMKMIVGDGSPAGDILQIEKTIAQGWLKDWLAAEQVSDAGEKARIWLEDLLEHHILQVSEKAKHIEFHHQLFQEYYAAEWLLARVENLDNETLKCDYLNYLKWTESVAIVLSLMDKEKNAVDLVTQALEVDLMLGARLAGELREQSSQKKCIELLVNSSFSSILQCGLVGRTHSPEAISNLEKFLKNQNWDVRILSVKALGETHGRKSRELLIESLKDKHALVRSSAAISLGKIGIKEDASYLEPLLRERLTSVSLAAQEALVQLGVEEPASKSMSLGDENFERFIERLRERGLASNAGINKRVEPLKPMRELLRNIESEDLETRHTAQNHIRIIREIGEQAQGDSVLMEEFSDPKLLKGLWEKQFKSNSLDLLGAIAAIQANCKFYNYEIEQQARERRQSSQGSQQQAQGNVYNIDSIGILNTGTVNNHGKQTP